MHGKQGGGSASLVDLEKGPAGAGYWLGRDSGVVSGRTTVQHPLCEQRCGDRKGLGTQGGKGDRSFPVRAKGDWEIEHCSQGQQATHLPRLALK